MVRIEITKVILTRGEDWALVEYRCGERTGSLGGKFGCQSDTLVSGQVFKGNLTLKRQRSGDKKLSFKGIPVSRHVHIMMYELKKAGINYTDRIALFSKFKKVSELLNALKHRHSAELMSIQKIGRKKLDRIYAAYESARNELSMSHKLSKHFPKLHAYMDDKKLSYVIKWKENIVEFMKFAVHDPWRILYDTEFDSFTFNNERRAEFLKSTKVSTRRKMVECIMQDLKLTSSDPRAKRAAAIHKIHTYMKSSGSYWMPLSQFMIDSVPIEPSWPCVIKNNHVTLTRFSDIESFIEKYLNDMEDGEQPTWTPPSEDAILDQKQHRAVIEACTNHIFILNGGAGTGKTTVCSEIVKSLKYNVLCAAPTGKAAQRMAEVTNVKAYTVHRLVYMQEPPSASVLLLDEQSMQEPEILARLFLRLSFKKIIFVGDVAQLTSVGPGQLFKDLCNSSFPKVTLEKIYRSSATSFISSNGQKIRNGIESLDQSEESFIIRKHTNDQEIIDATKSIYDNEETMPIVLCNTNVEVSKLNYPLREICNPIRSNQSSMPVNMDYSNGKWRYENWRFGIGDSVINTVNKYHEVGLPNSDEKTIELQVANGEIGTVFDIRQNGAVVLVHFDRPVEYNLIEDDITIRPAYALTVNKAQGSEYKKVIYKATSSWGDKRERLYTAITRAKKKCIVYEVGSSVKDCIRASPAFRKTFLFK